ncbi:hypothetical protein [Persicitalea jodogahamensis]|uniref:Outer membrane protein beta-barrel domain-containing protein n=1 Tax=Persicitalea jodogahamensis TaxID=402147 RepID=A0A8J3D540_9BACT|nr:hypothetical protein [Persicitalea jodogahamensis]GHB52880.1 hypothetical protein GCM10007390_01940 [Persicitalea jodogahamensis]
MKKILVLLIMLTTTLPTWAQETAFKKHYLNQTEVGIMLGRVKADPYAQQGGSGQEIIQNRTNLTLQMLNGIQYSSRLGVGIITGIDWYNSALINPIGAGLRYDLAGKKTTRLYASADAGYGFTWFHDDAEGYDTKGGLMLNPGLGLRIGKPEGAAFTLAFSYKHQEATVEKPPLWDQSSRTEDRNYNRFLVRLGVAF